MPGASEAGVAGTAAGEAGSSLGESGRASTDDLVGGAGAAAGSDGGSDSAGDASGRAGEPASGGAMAGAPAWHEPERDPVCSGFGALVNPIRLGISTDQVDHFGGISAGELAIAWTVVTGEQVTLHYARRDSAKGDFDAAQTLDLAAAPEAVSLSSDGLRVVYVNEDRKGFTQLTRESLDAAFAPTAYDDFELIAESAQLFAEDEFVGDPTLGSDDSSFIYSRFGAGRRATLLLTQRFSPYAPWPEGSALPVAVSLEATATTRQRPTGAASDLETLFLWDEAANVQRVATLSHETGTYDSAFELANARGAAPTPDCSRIYYEADGDLWTAELGPQP